MAWPNSTERSARGSSFCMVLFGISKRESGTNEVDLVATVFSQVKTVTCQKLWFRGLWKSSNNRNTKSVVGHLALADQCWHAKQGDFLVTVVLPVHPCVNEARIRRAATHNGRALRQCVSAVQLGTESHLVVIFLLKHVARTRRAAAVLVPVVFHRCSWCFALLVHSLGIRLENGCFSPLRIYRTGGKAPRLPEAEMVSWLMISLVFTFSSQEWPKLEISQKRGVLSIRFEAYQAEVKSTKIDELRQSNFSFNPKAPSFTLNPQARCCFFFCSAVCFWSRLFWCVVMHGMLKVFGCCASVEAKISIPIYFHCLYPAALCFSLQLCKSYMLYSTVHVMHTICNLHVHNVHNHTSWRVILMYLCALHAYIIEMTHVLSIVQVPLPNPTKSLAQAGEFTPGGPQAQPPAKHWSEMACGFQGAWQGNWGAKVPISSNEMSSWGPRDLPQASAPIPSDLEETLSPFSIHGVSGRMLQCMSGSWQVAHSFPHFQFPCKSWLRKASGKLAPQIWSVLETRARNWTKCSTCMNMTIKMPLSPFQVVDVAEGERGPFRNPGDVLSTCQEFNSRKAGEFFPWAPDVLTFCYCFLATDILLHLSETLDNMWKTFTKRFHLAVLRRIGQMPRVHPTRMCAVVLPAFACACLQNT